MIKALILPWLPNCSTDSTGYASSDISVRSRVSCYLIRTYLSQFSPTKLYSQVRIASQEIKLVAIIPLRCTILYVADHYSVAYDDTYRNYSQIGSLVYLRSISKYLEGTAIPGWDGTGG